MRQITALSSARAAPVVTYREGLRSENRRYGRPTLFAAIVSSRAGTSILRGAAQKARSTRITPGPSWCGSLTSSLACPAYREISSWSLRGRGLGSAPGPLSKHR
jgi:hypothetical protein